MDYFKKRNWKINYKILLILKLIMFKIKFTNKIQKIQQERAILVIIKCIKINLIII